MRVLVTRPEPDAGQLAVRIGKLGMTAVVDPMLEVELLPVAAMPFAGAAAIVATSRNALRALAQSPARSTAVTLPLFAVGAGTEALAHEIGFTLVTRGAGTARTLAETVAAALSGPRRSIVYLAGERVSFDLSPVLRSHGFDVLQLTAYRTVAAKSLRPETIAMIAAGEIDVVLLMSPRTAVAYRALVFCAGLEQAASRISHACLSASVAAALTPLIPRTVLVPSQPSTEDLLALVAAQRHTPPRAG